MQTNGKPYVVQRVLNTSAGTTVDVGLVHALDEDAARRAALERGLICEFEPFKLLPLESVEDELRGAVEARHDAVLNADHLTALPNEHLLRIIDDAFYVLTARGDAATLWTVITGDPRSGFSVTGPFSSEDAAASHGARYHGTDWWPLRLRRPEEARVIA